MNEAEKSLESMGNERPAVLSSLRALLERIGSANDAEDHGYHADAVQMREDACAAIRNLLAEHAFLGEMFPTLQWELDTGHILGFGWAELCDRVEKFDAG